jgi:hypothetical protein
VVFANQRTWFQNSHKKQIDASDPWYILAKVVPGPSIKKQIVDNLMPAIGLAPE